MLRELTLAKGVNLLRDMAEIPASSQVRQYFKMYLERFKPEDQDAPAPVSSKASTPSESVAAATPVGKFA